MRATLVSMLLAVLMLAAPAQLIGPGEEIGVDEHLGDTLPLDLKFRDENGQEVALRQLIDRPTLLTLVYFRCPSICSPFLNGVADVVGKLDLKPGQDYKVLTISFDDREGADLARAKKETYLKTFRTPYPPEGWRFLTGDRTSIDKVCRAVGYRFKLDGEDYLHPVTMMAISPDGKIVRYLYGMSFLPFDVKLALLEAAEGRVGATMNKVLTFCFSYDPAGKQYVFNFLKVSGTLLLFGLACFVVYLVITSRKSRKEKEPHVQS